MSSIQTATAGGASEDTGQQAPVAGVGVLEIGKKVPDFKLSCVDGKEHKLSDFLGTKVLLSFHRFTRCPACAYSVGKLMGSYKLLAWASKLKVITVFRTDVDSLEQGLTSSDAPIANLCNGDLYPFLALADPDGEAASAFQVNYKPLARQFLDFLPHIMELVRYHKTCNLLPPAGIQESFFNAKGANTLLPSELLIDEHGVLVDMFRSDNILDTMAMERISHFLLLGERLPDNK